MTNCGGYEIPDHTSGVLAALRAERAEVNAGEVRELQLAVGWAAMHSGDTLIGPATEWSEHDVALGGQGAPQVAEFCVPELALALGMTHDAGASYLGDAIDLRHRLPRTYQRVLAGHLRVWRARRIAQQTRCLPLDGAAFVDQHVAYVAHTISYTGLDRLVDEAITRYDPDQAAQRRDTAAEHRRFDLRFSDTARITATGTVQVDGSLDYGDALDLEAAVAHGAATLAALGSTDALGARRATAVGQLARRQLALDLNPDLEPATDHPDDQTDPGPADDAADEPTETQARAQEPAPKPPVALVKPRHVVIHVHLTAAAVGDPDALVRVENISSTGGHLAVNQIASWCADPDTHLTIKPVIDLNTTPRTDAYEIPHRIRDHVILRDRTCVFPGCNVNARRCDLDHTTPPRPRRPRRRGHLRLQPRPPVPTTPPPQDHRRLDLPLPRTRRLRVDHPARPHLPNNPPPTPPRPTRPRPPARARAISLTAPHPATPQVRGAQARPAQRPRTPVRCRDRHPAAVRLSARAARRRRVRP